MRTATAGGSGSLEHLSYDELEDLVSGKSGLPVTARENATLSCRQRGASGCQDASGISSGFEKEGFISLESCTTILDAHGDGESRSETSDYELAPEAPEDLGECSGDSVCAESVDEDTIWVQLARFPETPSCRAAAGLSAVQNNDQEGENARLRQDSQYESTPAMLQRMVFSDFESLVEQLQVEPQRTEQVLGLEGKGLKYVERDDSANLLSRMTKREAQRLGYIQHSGSNTDNDRPDEHDGVQLEKDDRTRSSKTPETIAWNGTSGPLLRRAAAQRARDLVHEWYSPGKRKSYKSPTFLRDGIDYYFHQFRPSYEIDRSAKSWWLQGFMELPPAKRILALKRSPRLL